MSHESTSRGRNAAPSVRHSDPDYGQTRNYPDSAVAVIGVACRFSGADSVEELWQILANGTSRCADLPQDRFPDSRSKLRTEKADFKANLMDEIDAFDHKFFGVASREAAFMDPQQRLGLQVTYQALESAGYFAREASEAQRDIGCYWATCMSDYYENVVTHAPSAFSLTGTARPFIAGKISHYFGFTGPSIMLDAACAASGASINVACRAVASGECSGALVGATNILVRPENFQDLAGGHFTSTTGPSKSFDAAADGYARGEGVAVIVLKKLSDALRDGDLIKAVISATAVNQCINDDPIIVPHGPSQMNLYRKVLRLAGLDAHDVSYVEAHGTGTRVGDPIEANSIREVFGDLSCDRSTKTYMGSLKSNIGHVEASSGLSGLIKVIIMMEKGIIPQQALFNNLNPEIAPLDPYGIEIPKSNVPWNVEYKAACVNNFGASGCNAAMVVTQPLTPLENKSTASPDGYPVSITAFSTSSLKSYCSALLDFINQPDASESLALDISYHLSRRRNPELPFSAVASISNLQELKIFLQNTLSEEPRKLEHKKRPVILFFGGQTGKPTTVPQALYDSCVIFRKHLDDCEATLLALGSPGIYPGIFKLEPTNDSVCAHSALFCSQYASARTWIDCGIQPARLIGHSFGQITALCISGVLSLHDALRLVTGRARLIDEVWKGDTGSMIAVEAHPDKLSDLLARHVNSGLETACYNGTHSFVVAGETSSVDELEASLKASTEPYRYKRLQVPNAFHSILTEPLVNPLQRIAEELQFQKPQFPLETCSKEKTWPSATPSRIASHIREPVYFHQAVKRITDELGPCIWIEAGSGSNVPMLRRALEPQVSSHDVKSFRFDSPTPMASLAQMTTELWQLGLKVQFWPFHQDQRHQYRVLNLPPYQFDKTRHWMEWKAPNAPVAKVHESPKETSLVQLIRKTKDTGEFAINTQFQSWRVICSEHRILGVPTCPASLLLDIVSKAIDTIQETSAQTPYTYSIRRLETPNPIPAEAEQVLTLNVRQTNLSSQLWEYNLMSSSHSRRDYASGTVFARPSSQANLQSDFARLERLIDMKRIQNLTHDEESDSVKGKGVYKSLAALFEIPKSNQVIREVSAKGNEAAAFTTSMGKSSLTTIENLIQIPLICLNSLQDRQDHEIFINTAVGEANFRDLPDLSDSENVSWSVYLKFFGSKDSENTCDMYVFHAQNAQLAAVLLDVNFIRVQTNLVQQALDGTATIDPQPTLLHPTEAFGHTKTYDPKAQHLELSAVGHTKTHEPLISNPEPSVVVGREECSNLDDLPDLTQTIFDLLVQVADVDINLIRGQAWITDLGIDSLMGMEVADEINKSFSLDIPIEEFLVVTTVDSLCELVASKTDEFSYSPATRPDVSLSDIGDSASSSNTEFSSVGKKQDTSCYFQAQQKSISTLLNAGIWAFDQVREEFDIFAKQTGCDNYYSQIYPAQTELAIAYIIEAFTKLGCDFSSLKAGERVPSITHLPKYDKFVKQLMSVLHDEGLVYRSGNDWIRANKPLAAYLSSAQLLSQIKARFPHFLAEHELLQVSGSKLAECLNGTQNPLQLLFGGSDKRKLMADYYHTSPLQVSITRQLASFIRNCFGSQKFCNPIQVLEVGGGTCGTSVKALAAFAALGIPVEYTFTDVSSSFITAAKTKLQEYSFVKYRTLDVTENPPSECMGAYDMIIAANVVHATRNTCVSVGNIRQMLRPDGFFTLVEYTRFNSCCELIFGVLDGWWLFDDGRSHALMDETKWKTTLNSAGYENVDWTGSQTEESNVAKIFLAY